MKKFLGVLLLVSLMATSLFATNFTWTSTTGGSFATTSNWSANPWGASGNYNDEYRGYPGMQSAAAVVDSAPSALPGRARIASNANGVDAKLDVVSGGTLSIAELRVADGTGANGGGGLLTQTGGNVVMLASNSGSSYSRNLMIGRGAASGPRSIGKYVISGGSLSYLDRGYNQTASNTGTWVDGVTYNTARLMVGTNVNSSGTHLGNEGTFTVIGDDATISMKTLEVGGIDNTRPDTVGHKGTMEFQLVDGAVSVVEVGSTILASTGLAEADLIVDLTSGTQADAILLIENTGASAVSGLFGNVTLLGGLTGSVVYTYNADTLELTGGNDIALIIPEPATIALLSLGLLAIRRKK